jgi:hypothetical protein
MLKPMPLDLIKTYNDTEAQTIDIHNFFGLLEVTLECPPSVERPMLPVKDQGRTIYPYGIFKGIYFSEELKAVLSLGYKIITIHSAKEFSQADLFTNYINSMYQIKMNSTGPER